VAERHEPVKYAKLTGSLFIPNTSGAVPPDRRCICASRQGIHYFSSRIEGIDSVIDVDVKYEVKPQQCQEILGIELCVSSMQDIRAVRETIAAAFWFWPGLILVKAIRTANVS
jgi:hypothetical protein